MKSKGAIFHQSLKDFPCTIELGNEIPSCNISRWRGDKGLRFIPLDDEGFTLCGNKRQLLYRGRRRSHRFTIHGDDAFEYDCILEKEPESNVVTLLMDGAEQYDFFRQPDFVRDDFLKGSYAVYKKETLIGQGTGKLCHIHRPLIIDARGRKVWGDLSVVDNELRIMIPEQWLSEAKYPVIVDPTIGSTQLGSLGEVNDFVNFPMRGRPALASQIGLSKYFVQEKGIGFCRAWYYHHWTGGANNARPCLFSDNNNLPNIKKSTNEDDFEFFNITGSNPARWVSGDFEIIDSINAGSFIWFGVRGREFSTRYDFVPNNLIRCGSRFQDPLPDSIPIPGFADFSYENIRYSWYFTYEAAPLSQDYFRTLTQGITLADTSKHTGDYKRYAEDNAKTSTSANRLIAFDRKLYEAVQGLENNYSTVLIFRSMNETIDVIDISICLRSFWVGLFENVKVDTETKQGWVLFRILSDTARTADIILRSLVITIKILSQVFIRGFFIRRFLVAQEELVLKSKVTNKLSLESKIN